MTTEKSLEGKLKGRIKKALTSLLAGSVLAGACAYTPETMGEVEVNLKLASSFKINNEFIQGTGFWMLLTANNKDETNATAGFKWATPSSQDGTVYDAAMAFDSQGHLLGTSTYPMQDFFAGYSMDSHNNELSGIDNVRFVSQGSSGVKQKEGIIGIYGFYIQPETNPGIREFSIPNVRAFDRQGNEQKVETKSALLYILPIDVNSFEVPVLYTWAKGKDLYNHVTKVYYNKTILESSTDLKTWKEVKRSGNRNTAIDYVVENFKEKPCEFYRARVIE